MNPLRPLFLTQNNRSNMRHHPKKGQMEMMGLVIIVILITLGILFMATFALKDDTQKKIFTRKGLASSTIDAVLKTTIGPEEGCGQPRLGQEILTDCARYYESYLPDSPEGGGYSEYRCKNMHSCAFFQKILSENLVAPTLDQWGKTYEFKFNLVSAGNSQELLNYKRKQGCPAEKERDSSGAFETPVQGVGIIESQLFICD